MFQHIRNFFNPKNNTKVFTAGFLEVADSLFIKDMRNSTESHRQGVICKTVEEAENLNLHLRLLAKVWQLATYGTFANPAILHITENLFKEYIESYEQPAQAELFPSNPNVFEWPLKRDEINYDDYRTAYLKKATKDFTPESKIKWGKVFGIKL